VLERRARPMCRLKNDSPFCILQAYTTGLTGG